MKSTKPTRKTAHLRPALFHPPEHSHRLERRVGGVDGLDEVVADDGDLLQDVALDTGNARSQEQDGSTGSGAEGGHGDAAGELLVSVLYRSCAAETAVG